MFRRLSLLTAAACAGTTTPETPTPTTPSCTESALQVAGSATPFADLVFEHPFGEEAPVRMATTSGDRAKGPHGTVGVFGPGFDSGPHTHTGAYHGVVLQGRMTNPFGTESDPITLGPGSYWFVPGGEQHATVCVSTDEDCVFYFHADTGFDFHPIEATTEPRSAQARAIPAEDLVYDKVAPFVSMAAATGDRGTGAHGTFGEFPGGATSPEHVHSLAYEGVVIAGSLINPFRGEASSVELTSGGVWSVPADAQHRTACESEEPCVFYFHATGAFDFTPVCE